MSTGMYPGVGLPLYRAQDSPNQREPYWTNGQGTPVIPNGKFSIGFAVNPGLQMDINVVFASAPTTNAFEVRFSIQGDFSDEYVLTTVAATTDTLYTWTTNSQLSGIIRIKNVGTADINTAYGQSRAATFG